MNEIIDLKFILSGFLIIIGWFIGQFFKSKNDLKNKKREVKLELLLTAYQVIASCANRKELSENEKNEFEKAIELIQFIGSNEQIKLLYVTMEDMQFTPLLEQLRIDIRNELKLEEVEDLRIKHFRFSNN
jgi:hypothetical protein